MGLGRGEGTQAPGSLSVLPTLACPFRNWGAACPLLIPAGEELKAPQGPGVGTNGSADYRCLLIKELNPFVFLAPILGPLEEPRARNWPEQRYKGKGCFIRVLGIKKSSLYHLVPPYPPKLNNDGSRS